MFTVARSQVQRKPGSADEAARCYGLVPCAGVGVRAAAGGPKQYTMLGARTVVAHTLAALDAVPRLTATLVVLAPQDAAFDAHAPAFAGPRAWVARCGGSTRAASVAAGLQTLLAHGAREQDWVLVHDAARCLLQPAWVDRLIDACLPDETGGLLALPVADTLKAAAVGSARVQTTLPRTDKHLAQTPQMFKLGPLLRALVQAQQAGVEITDESSAMEAMGYAPLLVPGEAENLKVTWPSDLALARRLLETR